MDPMHPAPPTWDELLGQTLLGIDYGSRRIGVAIKPAGQDWVLPKTVIQVESEPAAAAALQELIAREKAEGVVVGLPEHPDTRQARDVKRFCRRVRRDLTGVRWFFVDERFTTEAAHSISIDRPRRRPSDELAATLILETFLQRCR
ncbi:MAG TPA: RuvX/YqgF family protein [Candidatus Sumerlaeota bacterium]|nr:RuvX/YqgF family protein [Candidatus Sumerlaeota bacterium]HPK03764.1 RuvX/YqgF family protein [Candidatus Sumerlaeota bacterium]